MKLSLYMDDWETEKIFSYLRWIFLSISILFFYFPPLADRLQFTKESFPVLLALGFTYMIATQIVLMKLSSGKRYFAILAKGGILFDFIALNWLLVLTNGTMSPLFPIAFLLVMHATIYWRTKGALISSAALTIAYFIIFLSEGKFEFYNSFVLILNIFFIWIVGVFGSMIVIRERKHFKQKEIFHELMFTDYLTGLYNHRHFQEQLRLLTDAGQNFILVMGDIDYFKQINDRFGHLKGDEILKRIGAIFQEQADKSDAQAFRYGGEEFAFLLPTMNEDRQIAFFEKLYSSLDMEEFGTESTTITMSFGVAGSGTDAMADKLLGRADQLLYKAKEAGRNQVIFESGNTYRYLGFNSIKDEIAATTQ